MEDTPVFPVEQPSSIKLTKNSKGYAWEIKVYDLDHTNIIGKVEKLNTELLLKYSEVKPDGSD